VFEPSGLIAMCREAIFILLSHIQRNAALIHLLNERIAANGASVNDRRQELTVNLFYHDPRNKSLTYA
jgi:hypothetical protein